MREYAGYLPETGTKPRRIHRAVPPAALPADTGANIHLPSIKSWAPVALRGDRDSPGALEIPLKNCNESWNGVCRPEY